MWVDSKTVSEILDVKYDTLQKSIRRASLKRKKFCLLKFNKLYFNSIDGIGYGGKVLQIKLSDEILKSKRAKEILGDRLDENANYVKSCDDGILRYAQNDGLGGQNDKDIYLNVSNEVVEVLNNNETSMSSDNKVNNDKLEVDGNNTITLNNKAEIKNNINDEATKVNIKDLENMTRVRAVNEFKSVPAGMSKTIWGKSVANKYKVSLKTLYAWAKKQNSDEIEVVENGINFKATFNTSSFDIDALEWAVGFMINNPLATKKRAYEELESVANKEKWEIGSYKSFARQINKPEIKAMLLKATNGDRGIRNQIAPFVMRDLNCYESMELICGDQIVFDFNAICPMGEIVNPNAFVWVDMGSGAVIGVDVKFGKYNKFSVGRALKMALGFGVPDAIYTDNGKPELSNYVKNIRSQLSGIQFRDIDELNPSLLHKKAKVRNSRAKPIENIFNHIQRWMMEDIICKKGGAGYHRDNRSKDVIAEYMKETPLNYDEFIAFFANAIKKWNEHFNESRKIVPMESFINKLNDNSRLVFSNDTLDYIFSERRKIKVRNSFVNFSEKGKKYTFTHTNLTKLNGEFVEIRIDEDNKDSVKIINLENNEYICTAYRIDRIDPRDENKLKTLLERNENVVRAVRDAFGYYKKLYKRPNTIGIYSNTAKDIKKKDKESKDRRKRILMKDEDLLEAM